MILLRVFVVKNLYLIYSLLRGRGARLALLAAISQSLLWSDARRRARAAQSATSPRVWSRLRADRRGWRRRLGIAGLTAPPGTTLPKRWKSSRTSTSARGAYSDLPIRIGRTFQIGWSMRARGSTTRPARRPSGPATASSAAASATKWRAEALKSDDDQVDEDAAARALARLQVSASAGPPAAGKPSRADG